MNRLVQSSKIVSLSLDYTLDQWLRKSKNRRHSFIREFLWNNATVAWAAKNRGNTKKLSITGFCWGGTIVWLYSAYNPNLDAGVVWYGLLTPTPNSPASEAQPITPSDHVKELKVPVIGFYGGLDTGIPLDSVQRMQDELKKGKSGSEIIVYPNAKHGFHADYRDSFNKESSEDAWKNCSLGSRKTARPKR